MDSTTSWAARRVLPDHLADAIAQAKEQSGMSWRDLEAETGLHNSYLVRLSHGTRVPSTVAARRILAVLDLDEDIADELRDIAVADHGLSRTR